MSGVQTVVALYTATPEGSFQKLCESRNYSIKTLRYSEASDQASVSDVSGSGTG